jgi:hypothetical protein
MRTDYSLHELQGKREFYEHGPAWVRSIWPTKSAFEWFCKSRRVELVASGGMGRIGREWLIDTAAFSEAVGRALNARSQVDQLPGGQA